MKKMKRVTAGFLAATLVLGNLYYTIQLGKMQVF